MLTKGLTGMSLSRDALPVIGLTGGIGSGKSTAASYLVSMGFAHIDADEIGRQLTRDGSPVLSVIKKTFGPEIFSDARDSHLVLDRKKTAELVFTDKKSLEIYNGIMFSEIISEIVREIDSIRKSPPEGCPGIIIDAPLLYEAGVDKLCDLVILISVDTDVRIERVCRRDGATPEEVRRRIDNQMSEEAKRAAADFVVDNSGGPEELEARLKDVAGRI